MMKTSWRLNLVDLQIVKAVVPVRVEQRLINFLKVGSFDTPFGKKRPSASSGHAIDKKPPTGKRSARNAFIAAVFVSASVLAS